MTSTKRKALKMHYNVITKLRWLEKQMTNNSMWDCADMPPMFSAKWNRNDSSDFLHFFLCIFGI
jgi:hypothetical protein